MGDLKSGVRQLIYKWRLEELSDSEFKTGVQNIINEFATLGPIVFQDIGLVVQERQMKNRSEEETERIWVLLDEVDRRIRKSVEHFDEAMKM